jgi:hypothetical protein
VTWVELQGLRPSEALATAPVIEVARWRKLASTDADVNGQVRTLLMGRQQRHRAGLPGDRRPAGAADRGRGVRRLDMAGI